MDTITHILSGALIARAIVPISSQSGNAEKKPAVTVRTAMVCGAAAAAFPDIDIVAKAFGQLAYLLNHRGITHSLLALPLWSLLLAFLFAVLARQREHWPTFYRYAFAGLLIHILGDLITSFGTMILTPFSNARFGWGTTFIIDLWLTGILVTGLLLSWRWRTSRLPAIGALLLICALIGFQSVQKERAIDLGQAYAHRQGWTDSTVDALPQALSPFHWLIVIRNADRYAYAYVDLQHRQTLLPQNAGIQWLQQFNAQFSPPENLLWQQARQFGSHQPSEAISRHAFHHPAFAFFRWFAVYPVFHSLTPQADGTCAWFEDLRFRFPGQERPTFRFGMCARGEEWLPARWHRTGAEFLTSGQTTHEQRTSGSMGALRLPQ